MSKLPLRIDIISDVVCPWCAVGYYRLARALEMVSDQVEAELHWHPFILNAQVGAGGVNYRTHLTKKYGMTLDQVDETRANITALGAEVGFTFNYAQDMHTFNTHLAHQLLAFAKIEGKGHALKLRLFEAFFTEGKNVDDMDVLIEEVSAIGLDIVAARAAVESGQYAQDVTREAAEWSARGVQSVPTFVFDQRAAMQGAQSVEAMAQIVLEMAQEAAKA